MPVIAETQSRSNAVYVITPWKRSSDLHRVKCELFSVNQDGDKRQHGVDTVAAWTMRGNVPHAIHSTALLTSAQLQHEDPHSTPFSIQATYAIAFCRFITGYCDISMAGQIRSKNMHQVALDLDMPASWVDLRHEATHGTLPSLKRLESTTKQALSWLWEHYWVGLDGQEEADQLLHASVKAVSSQQLRPILTTFLKNRVEEVKRRTSGSAADSASSKVCLELVRLCRGDETCLRNLVVALVEPKILVPADRGLGDSLEGAFVLWTPLLRALARYQSSFLRLLVSRFAAILAEPGHLDSSSDAFKEALYEWLGYALTNFQQRPPASQEYMKDEALMSAVMDECILTPLTHWTEKIVKDMANNCPSLGFLDTWQAYFPDLKVSWQLAQDDEAMSIMRGDSDDSDSD